jgi:hypothetical protein
MPDWSTRLAVTYVDPTSKATIAVSPIDSFSPTFALNADVLHSIEQTHIGVVYNPQAISFSMTVKAIGNVVGQLTQLAMTRQRFDITLQEATGDDWSFHSVVLRDCVITSASPSPATVSGAPAATFSGVSLHATADTKAAGAATIPVP